MSLVILSRSAEQTAHVGLMLGECLKPGDIIAFYGDLGSGKTWMIKGICQGLGVPAGTYVTSPTFVILNRYRGRLPVCHFDFYRLICPEEVIEVGFEECIAGEEVCMIEWADRAEGLIPRECLKIRMEVLSPQERRIAISAYGTVYQTRLADLIKRLASRDAPCPVEFACKD